METAVKDILLLYEEKDTNEWTKYFFGEFEQAKPQIQSVNSEDVCTNLDKLEALCPHYAVICIVLSSEMLKTLITVATPLSPVLKVHGCVTLLKLYLEEKDETELGKNVMPKYPGSKSWQAFEISEENTQEKVAKSLSSVIDLVQKVHMQRQRSESSSGSLGLSKGAKPKQPHMINAICPESIRQGGEQVMVCLNKSIPENTVVQVCVGENDLAPKIDTKVLNKYTFRFSAPENKAGMSTLYIFFDGAKQCKRPLKYSNMLEFAYTFPEFLCQLIGLDVDDRTGLDSYLTNVFKSSIPEDSCMAEMLRPKNIANAAGTHSSTDELPTLMHFACKYELSSLLSSVLDVPGATEVLEITNNQGKTAIDIARESGNTELVEYIEVFQEMVDYNTQIEDLYEQMKRGKIVGDHKMDDGVHNLPGFKGYMRMTPNAPGSDGSYISNIRLPESEYEFGQKPNTYLDFEADLDDYERTEKIAASRESIKEVDPGDDIHESDKPPAVPERTSSQKKPVKLAHKQVPSIPDGYRESPPVPARRTSDHTQQESDEEKAIQYGMPLDDPFFSPLPLSQEAMGSSTLEELNEVMGSFKRGEITLQDVDKLYRVWIERNRHSSKSMKEKKKHLEHLKQVYDTVAKDEKKSRGIFSKLTLRKPKHEKNIHIEHHVAPPTHPNNYTTWGIMKGSPGNRDSTLSTVSNASTSSSASSSSTSSRDSALGVIPDDEDMPVTRRSSEKKEEGFKRQSWGNKYLANRQQQPAKLPKPPPHNPTVHQLITKRPTGATAKTPPVPPRR
ncbi:phosphoinositide 3-kinase adapter protein 1-like [Mya arenaria]|uniref:phosphoinositide 3-kinase adapter protein 1-like n=1 Tax=Mya arenaria TaxID=6604 RepID=UPI0022E94767|nr:phosphoinositide 3-kinase adapter protein 1-like [Mya arenaria]XP_052767948.1 phosphoinositide 3-kinase adapter protein 1-like [Mya arenaria]XP_052767956.1 phosphoinositide 3-kinase adapter protein 1-like [Mya arenaria]XP_052767963.1 phosphoinositide 3-kinase adapter protein 1-like [Mya arenaria]